ESPRYSSVDSPGSIASGLRLTARAAGKPGRLCTAHHGGGRLWQNAGVRRRLAGRKEWQFFSVLPKADPGLAAAWWASLLLRGILPAVFGIAMGILVGAVQRGSPLAGPLTFAGAIFVLL